MERSEIGALQTDRRPPPGQCRSGGACVRDYPRSLRLRLACQVIELPCARAVEHGGNFRACEQERGPLRSLAVPDGYAIPYGRELDTVTVAAGCGCFLPFGVQRRSIRNDVIHCLPLAVVVAVPSD